MPELPEQSGSVHPTPEQAGQPASTQHDYQIIRKGSFYNITGPHGRIFKKNKSASVIGPRWEELTHTPWPYKSSAYQSGLRLWELGIIPREHIGRTQLVTPAAQPEAPARLGATPAAESIAAERDPRPETPDTKPAGKTPAITLAPPPLALPAPGIDLAKHEAIITALRRNPALLFRPDVRSALQNEVAYHRPYAKWAEQLLKLLARYEARQKTRTRTVTSPVKSETIMVRHIAWQEQRQREAPANTQ